MAATLKLRHCTATDRGQKCCPRNNKLFCEAALPINEYKRDQTIPKSTQNHQDPPRINKEPPRGIKNHQNPKEPPRPSMNYQEPSRNLQNHKEPRRTTMINQEPPRTNNIDNFKKNHLPGVLIQRITIGLKPMWLKTIILKPIGLNPLGIQPIGMKPMGRNPMGL